MTLREKIAEELRQVELGRDPDPDKAALEVADLILSIVMNHLSEESRK